MLRKPKTDWRADPDDLLEHAEDIAESACERLSEIGLEERPNLPLFKSRKPAVRRSELLKLPPDAEELLLTNSISPIPLHRVLVLLETIHANKHEILTPYERLAIAKAVVAEISNLEFGPEVGVGPAKSDAPAVTFWLDAIRTIAEDLRALRDVAPVSSRVFHADSRNIVNVLKPDSIDIVITSPPYPNEKDYTRTTRLESVLLGFIRTKQDLRALKQALVRSNTRGVYETDRDHLLVENHDEIQNIADSIEARRIQLGKTSGFEKLYAKVTKLYFGGMAKHFLAPNEALAITKVPDSTPGIGPPSLDPSLRSSAKISTGPTPNQTKDIPVRSNQSIPAKIILLTIWNFSVILLSAVSERLDRSASALPDHDPGLFPRRGPLKSEQILKGALFIENLT